MRCHALHSDCCSNRLEEPSIPAGSSGYSRTLSLNSSANYGNRGKGQGRDMRMRHEGLTLSATDLANHLACPHLTGLDVSLARGEIPSPSWENPHLVVLQQRGLQHEKAYLGSLRARGRWIVDLSNQPEATLA